MSDWGDSPPPMIVQLRGLLEDTRPVCSDQKQIDMMVELCDALIERYPVLVDNAMRSFPTQYAG